MERLYDDTIDRALRDAQAAEKLSAWSRDAYRQTRRYLVMARKSVAAERVFWLDLARAARKQARHLRRSAERRLAIGRASLLSLEDQLRASMRMKGAA